MLNRYGSCVFTEPPFASNIIMNDGTIHNIDDPDEEFPFSGSSDDIHTFLSGGNPIGIIKSDVAEVHVEMPLSIASRDNFCSSLFSGYVNCTIFDIRWSDSLTVSYTGLNAFSGMFSGCEKLTTLPSTFAFTNTDIISSVGGYFMSAMFMGCTSLTRTPEHVIIPTSVRNVGYASLSYMFSGCTSLVEVTSNITLFRNASVIGGNNLFAYMFEGCTQLATLHADFKPMASASYTAQQAGPYFMAGMFRQCSNLTSLPDGFNIPPNADSSTDVNDYYLYDMFYQCTSLTSLPDGFNIPQNIRYLRGIFMCGRMFSGCTSLASLPDGFTLSFLQNNSNLGHNMLSNMFRGCTSLTTLPDGFQIFSGTSGNYNSSNNMCQLMFYGCTGLTTLPESFRMFTNAQYISGQYFCTSMFEGCTSLTGFPNGFRFPRALTVGGFFLDRFCYGCESLTSLPDGMIIFTTITTVQNNFMNESFRDCTNLTHLPSDSRLANSLTTLPLYYMYRTFYNTGLTNASGTSGAALYFAQFGNNTFELTSVTPVSPSNGETVYIA